MDTGVSVMKLDLEKLDRWWERHRRLLKTVMGDGADILESQICQFCLWNARATGEAEEAVKELDWWKGHDSNKFFEKFYYKDAVIRPCTVRLSAIPHQDVENEQCADSFDIKDDKVFAVEAPSTSEFEFVNIKAEKIEEELSTRDIESEDIKAEKVQEEPLVEYVESVEIKFEEDSESADIDIEEVSDSDNVSPINEIRIVDIKAEQIDDSDEESVVSLCGRVVSPAPDSDANDDMCIDLIDRLNPEEEFNEKEEQITGLESHLQMKLKRRRYFPKRKKDCSHPSIEMFMCSVCLAHFGSDKERKMHENNDHGLIYCHKCHRHKQDVDTLWKHFHKYHMKDNAIANLVIMQPGQVGIQPVVHLLSSFTCCDEKILNKEQFFSHNSRRAECVYCRNFFPHNELVDHVESDHGPVSIKCHYFKCANYFLSEAEKDLHVSTIHERNCCRLKECLFCSCRFNTKAYCRHIMDAHRTEAVWCTFKACNHASRSLEENDKHFNETHATFNCTYCSEVFSNKYALQYHIQIVHKKRQIACKHQGCNELLETKDDLLIHIVEQHADSFNMCQECGRVNGSEKKLKYHVRRMHGNENIQCPQCPKVFSTKVAFKFHTKTVHELQRDKFCKHCNQFYKYLYHHLRADPCKHCKVTMPCKTLATNHVLHNECEFQGLNVVEVPCKS